MFAYGPETSSQDDRSDAANQIPTSFGLVDGHDICEIAQSLGLSRFAIPRCLPPAARPLTLTRQILETEEPCAKIYDSTTADWFSERLDALAQNIQAQLVEQGFSLDQITLGRALHMRFYSGSRTLVISEPLNGDFHTAFLHSYKSKFGFLLDDQVLVNACAVTGTSTPLAASYQSVVDELEGLTARVVDETKSDSGQPAHRHSLGNGHSEVVAAPTFIIDALDTGDVVVGPALVVDENSTILIASSWAAVITPRHLVIAKIPTRIQ